MLYGIIADKELNEFVEAHDCVITMKTAYISWNCNYQSSVIDMQQGRASERSSMCSLEFAYKHGFITKLDYENTDVNAITDMFTG